MLQFQQFVLATVTLTQVSLHVCELHSLYFCFSIYCIVTCCDSLHCTRLRCYENQFLEREAALDTAIRYIFDVNCDLTITKQ